MTALPEIGFHINCDSYSLINLLSRTTGLYFDFRLSDGSTVSGSYSGAQGYDLIITSTDGDNVIVPIDSIRKITYA